MNHEISWHWALDSTCELKNTTDEFERTKEMQSFHFCWRNSLNISIKLQEVVRGPFAPGWYQTIQTLSWHYSWPNCLVLLTAYCNSMKQPVSLFYLWYPLGLCWGRDYSCWGPKQKIKHITNKQCNQQNNAIKIKK